MTKIHNKGKFVNWHLIEFCCLLRVHALVKEIQLSLGLFAEARKVTSLSIIVSKVRVWWLIFSSSILLLLYLLFSANYIIFLLSKHSEEERSKFDIWSLHQWLRFWLAGRSMLSGPDISYESFFFAFCVLNLLFFPLWIFWSSLVESGIWHQLKLTTYLGI